MSRRVDWDARAPRIAQMASQGLSDVEIGEVYGVPYQVIQEVRKRHGIPAGWKQKTIPKVNNPPEQKPETVTVDGVTHCPPRWADGAAFDHRVRPRRK